MLQAFIVIKMFFGELTSVQTILSLRTAIKKCRADKPTLNFDECALMEYYPLQLREEDDPKQWVGYANLLRRAYA